MLAAAMRARIHKSVRTVTAMLDSRWSSHRVPENSQGLASIGANPAPLLSADKFAHWLKGGEWDA